MTYIPYGWGPTCDMLHGIQLLGHRNLRKPTSEQLNGFMAICKDMITNMILPYNIGWRASPEFEQVEYKE